MHIRRFECDEYHDLVWLKSEKKLILDTQWCNAIETQIPKISIAKAGCPPQPAAHL